MNARVYKADGLLLLTAAIWGAAFVAQRVGMEDVGPLTFNGVRFALGALMILPLVLRGGSEGGHAASKTDRRVALLGCGLAGLDLFAAATLQQAGLVYTTAGKAGFITGLYVVFVPLLGLVPGIPGQRPDRGTWIGAILAAVGLYFLSVTESLTIAYGDILVLVGAFLWACHVLILAWFAPRMRPVLLAFGQCSVCSILSLATALLVEHPTLPAIQAAAVPILYGGLMSVGIAYTLQVVAQRDSPPAHASIILSLESPFAALTGWILLGEYLRPRSILGCLLMLTGFLVAQLWPMLGRGSAPAPRQGN